MGVLVNRGHFSALFADRHFGGGSFAVNPTSRTGIGVIADGDV